MDVRRRDVVALAPSDRTSRLIHHKRSARHVGALSEIGDDFEREIHSETANFAKEQQAPTKRFMSVDVYQWLLWIRG